jgi:Rps23 Pro-64 3,4-dihydroxylase Tpa1-like proline 4-hydroxylase
MKSHDQLQAEMEDIQQKIASSEIINNIDLLELRDKCLSAAPFPHIAIDGMWNDEFLTTVSNEIDNCSDWAGEKQFYGSRAKRWQDDWEKFPFNTNRFISELNQPLVLRIVEFLTNQNKLVPDPYLNGGGIHSTGENGFLKLHADFNWNENLNLYRRINILVYLNKDWKSEYGGQIELAGKNGDGEFTKQVSLDPIFNRTLIFITDDASYHGQPNPVKNPLKKRRNSIAAYYYMASKPLGTSDVKRTGTNYVDKSGKKIGRALVQKALSKVLKFFG